jgi:hypothetical protein
MDNIQNIFLLSLRPDDKYYGKYCKIIGFNCFMDKDGFCYHVEHWDGCKSYISLNEAAKYYQMSTQLEISKKINEAHAR